MSLFVNPSGKIVMASNAKPIECFRCPCKNIIGDPYAYCVQEDFYAGDGCTGGIVNTLQHKCMCMTAECSGDWDKVAFCQDRVRYTYESGPHFGLICPDNCEPIVPVPCPSDCLSCGTLSFVITGVTGSGMCTEFNTTFSVPKLFSCFWNGSKELPSRTVALNVQCAGSTWKFAIGLGDGTLDFTMSNTTGCPTGTYTFSACGSTNCSGCDFSSAVITAS